jgi:hypothetical protein
VRGPGADGESGLGGGRPDQRFPQAPMPEFRPQHNEILVSVVATVNLTTGQGKIRYVNPLPDGRPSGIEQKSPVVVRALGGQGENLHEYPVQVNLYSELSQEADREGLVNAVIPTSPEARVLELVVAERVADRMNVGGAPPMVRGVQRVSAPDKELTIALALDKELPDGHTFSVQITTDHGRTWQTVGVGLKEPVFTIDRSQFPAGVELQVRVLATNGLSNSIVTTELFRV